MKNKILIFMLVPLMLTACSKQNTDIEKETDTVENVAVNFLSDYENGKNKNYVNLDFSNCSARLPQFDTCCNLNVTIKHEPADSKERLESFEKYCDFFSISMILQTHFFHQLLKV